VGSRVSAYANLVALPHAVFALPFAVGAAALALREAGRPPSAARLGLVILAVVCARTAAMAFNRLIDRRFDALNPRTAGRELVRGAVSPRGAALLTALSAAGFVATAAALGRWPLLLSPLALVLLLGYSLAKRFTWATHLWLGVALGGAPAGAWIAMRGDFGWAPAVLSLAVAAWVAGFDLIYSCQDALFDRQQRLGSLPARFGVARALAVSSGLHALSVLGLCAFGLLLQLGAIYFAGVAAIGAVLIYEHRIVSPNDLSRVDRAFFTLNGWVSLVFGACTVAEALR
jgi:4-hydroxybenzoate polyprenyltransferase